MRYIVYYGDFGMNADIIQISYGIYNTTNFGLLFGTQSKRKKLWGLRQSMGAMSYEL